MAWKPCCWYKPNSSEQAPSMNRNRPQQSRLQKPPGEALVTGTLIVSAQGHHAVAYSARCAQCQIRTQIPECDD